MFNLLSIASDCAVIAAAHALPSNNLPNHSLTKSLAVFHVLSLSILCSFLIHLMGGADDLIHRCSTEMAA